MSEKKNSKSRGDNQKVIKSAVNALVTKKEIKARVQNGEKLKKVAKEKGFNVVLPI